MEDKDNDCIDEYVSDVLKMCQEIFGLVEQYASLTCELAVLYPRLQHLTLDVKKYIADFMVSLTYVNDTLSVYSSKCQIVENSGVLPDDITTIVLGPLRSDFNSQLSDIRCNIEGVFLNFPEIGELVDGLRHPTLRR
jgi:hypothetical protein